jgi:hypothetical protein
LAAPRGARNRVAARVREDIFAHWNEPVAPGSDIRKGPAALEILYREKQDAYLRLTIGTLVPKEFVFDNIASDLDDHELDQFIADIRARLNAAPMTIEAEKIEDNKCLTYRTNQLSEN